MLGLRVQFGVKLLVEKSPIFFSWKILTISSAFHNTEYRGVIRKSLILPLIWYGCETLSPTLWYKALFIVPTDAHNYKIIGILKQLKFRQLL